MAIPQAFPYLLMKLHAFDDRRARRQPDKERQHALDLYAIVGMMTEPEYDRAKELGAAHARNQHVDRACAIVAGQFASRTAGGLLRLREHPLFQETFQLEEFMAVLAEVFPTR